MLIFVTILLIPKNSIIMKNFSIRTNINHLLIRTCLMCVCLILCAPYALSQKGKIKLDGETMEFNISGMSKVGDPESSFVSWGIIEHYVANTKTNQTVWVNCSNVNKPTKLAAKEIRIEVEFYGDAVNGQIPQVDKPIYQIFKNEKRASYKFTVPSNCKSGVIRLYYRTQKGNYMYVHDEFFVRGITSPTPPKVVSTDECDVCSEKCQGLEFKGITGSVWKVCNQAYKGSNSHKAKAGEKIFRNDLITTYDKSKAMIRYTPTGSTYTLGANSSFLVTSGSNTLDLVAGTLLVNYNKADKNLQIVLKKLRTFIKGTIVAFEETGSESRVWLFAGEVEVKSEKTGKTSTLKPGQKAIVGKNNNIVVSSFDIKQGASKFDIPMSDINNHYGNVNNGQSSNTSTSTSSGKYARYGAKRGIVKSVDEGDDIRMYYTTWWDDYGRLERSEIIGCEEKKGGKWVSSSYSQIINIIVDDKHYMYNKSIGWKQMKNTKTSFLGSGTKTVDGCKLTKSGTATVNGKPCDVFKGKKSNSTLEYYIWEGVVLKRVEKDSDGTSTTTVKSIELPNSIDSSKFAIPKTAVKH